MKISSISALATLLTLGAGIASANAAPVKTNHTAPTTALAKASTIQVQEEFVLYGQGGKREPFFHNTILIRRPSQIKMVVAQAEPGKKPHLYVASGTTEHEYNALTNQYNIVKPLPDGRSGSQLRDMAQIELILHAGHPAAPGKGISRTVTQDTLDGQAMILTTDTPASVQGHDGNAYSYTTKTWVAAKTSLPYRWMAFVTTGGKTTPLQELDFSHWVLNKSIPAAQLAWAPPAGSKPFSEPTLLAIGSPAPDFEVTQSDGKVVHLSDFRGKTVVLDFWATWCGPCQSSMPHLEHVYQQIKDKDVAVLGLCVWDEKDAYDKWVTKNIGTTYTFPVAFDPAGRGAKSIASSLYKVTGIPTQYIIDKDGKIAATTVGYDQGDSRLEANLSKLGVDISVPQKTAAAK